MEITEQLLNPQSPPGLREKCEKQQEPGGATRLKRTQLPVPERAPPTWDSTSTAAGPSLAACPLSSGRLPLPRGGGVSMLLSIPFSIMSSRPPDATMTRNVSTDGRTAELRRAEPEFTAPRKFTSELPRVPPLLLEP